jgi:muramoyltetrapeptide carboxypeptidase
MTTIAADTTTARTMHTELGPLQVGARVALVSPSGPAPREQLDRSIALLKEWRLEPVVGAHVGDPHPTAPYLAGADADRAADLQQAWCDPTIDAVFCIRGGYGSVRFLDLLDVVALRAARPKPLFGSSDVTAITEFWDEQLDCATWFAPMLSTLALLDDPEAQSGLHQAVFEPWRGTSYTRRDARTLVPGVAGGRLTGGNLSLLAMTTGARSRPIRHSEPRIALLEDVTEAPYRIDGFLVSLLRAGWFDGVTGIVLGSWLDCGDPAAVEAVVADLLVPLGLPTVWELGFGHGPAAPSVPLGVKATLTASDAPELSLDAAQ